MRTIRDIFQQFCRERHAEDKGRNYNLLQEIYADTELFDLSLIEDERKTKFTKKDNDNIVPFTRNENNLYATLKSFSLPFKSCFVRIDPQLHLFIREYSPDIVTGAMYLECEMVDTRDRIRGKKIWNIPFTLNVSGEFAKATCTCPPEWFIEDGFDVDEDNMCSDAMCFDVVREVGEVFETLSKKAVMSDIPTITKYDYYRRKKAPTIKVARRPIYYVLGDKNKTNEVRIKYACKGIKSEGKLEYSYAFKVRGHWRRIGDKSFGKDRSGVYGVKGFTWVVDHIRGEGELLKRLRVIR